jgi:ABC-type antimicrobial peptide transport system permease subunit
MDARLGDSLIAQRSPALLAAIFSLIALLLTAIGTYGVLSYAVALRRGEIGVRMALGALPRQIQMQFLAIALRLLAIGTVLGVIGAWWAGRAMRGLLYHVPPIHLPVLIGTGVAMALVSFVACLVPSQRAARISPIEGLARQQ